MAAVPKSCSIRSSWLYLATPFAAAGGAGLDLTGVQPYCQIRNKHILGLTRAVGADDAISGLLGPHRIHGAGDRADLVGLDQHRIGCLLLYTLLDALGVGDEQIVPTSWSLLPKTEVSFCQPDQSSSSNPSSSDNRGNAPPAFANGQ